MDFNKKKNTQEYVIFVLLLFVLLSARIKKRFMHKLRMYFEKGLSISNEKGHVLKYSKLAHIRHALSEKKSKFLKIFF